jgi:hypothetical protein
MGKPLDEGLYCIAKLFSPGSSLSREPVDTHVSFAKKKEPFIMKKIGERVKGREKLDPRPSWEIERDEKIQDLRERAKPVCPY